MVDTLQTYNDIEQINPGIRVSRVTIFSIEDKRFIGSVTLIGSPYKYIFIALRVIFVVILALIVFNLVMNGNEAFWTNDIYSLILVIIATLLEILFEGSLRLIQRWIGLYLLRKKGVLLKAHLREVKRYTEKLTKNSNIESITEVVELIYSITPPNDKPILDSLKIKRNTENEHGDYLQFNERRPWLAVLYVNKNCYAIF